MAAQRPPDGIPVYLELPPDVYSINLSSSTLSKWKLLTSISYGMAWNSRAYLHLFQEIITSCLLCSCHLIASTDTSDSCPESLGTFILQSPSSWHTILETSTAHPLPSVCQPWRFLLNFVFPHRKAALQLKILPLTLPWTLSCCTLRTQYSIGNVWRVCILVQRHFLPCCLLPYL